MKRQDIPVFIRMVHMGLFALGLLLLAAGCSRPAAEASGAGSAVGNPADPAPAAAAASPAQPEAQSSGAAAVQGSPAAGSSDLGISSPTGTTVSHAIALLGEPKYGPAFTHFEYVNPNAPVGGTLSMHDIGTYDSFHRYATRGVAASGSTLFYDTLMTASLDEVEVYYGLIAEKVEYPADFSWIIFHINPRARFQDGRPITADDVVFSFNKFFEEGVPQFKTFFAYVAKVEALDKARVRFSVKEPGKKALIDLATLTVLPKHYWESRKFSEPSTEIPVGSGAYTVKDHKIGQYVVYELMKDYWGLALPVNKGQNNFDRLRYDYYRDETVAFEAFKAGEYDLYVENIAKNWATMYTGPAFSNGNIKKEEIPHEIPQGMQALVFNTERPVFQDRRVRMALNYAMDFEWMNKNLFYGQYQRTRSYFQNTKYEARGLPGPEELKILEPIRDKIPAEVFTQEYNPPKTDGSGNIRDQVRKANALLKEAGWQVRGGKMTNVKSGQPMEFEVLLYSPSMERVVVPVQDNLKKMGITMNIRLVDTTQFINRLRDRDFDLISGGYGASFYPSSDLAIVWRSNFLDSTYNTAGVQDPAVDYLIDGITANQNNEEALLAWGKALDRVLTWNHYVIPEWHTSTFRVAYWDKFSKPAVRPKYDLGYGTWWIDRAKAARLPQQRQ